MSPIKFKSSPVKIILFAVIILLLAVAAYFSFPRILRFLGFLLGLFLPFILGYLLSILVNPLANFLQKKFKLPRAVSAILVIVLSVGIVGGILTGVIWKIVDEIRNLYDQFPAIYQSMQTSFESLSGKWAVIYQNMPENIRAIVDNMAVMISDKLSTFINAKSSPMVQYASDFAKRLPNIFISIIVFVLSSFFMITDAKMVSSFMRRVFPEKIMERFHDIRGQIKLYLGGYIKAQLIIMSITFVIIFAGLSILRVNYALLIAIGVALLDALPFFGTGAVLWPWAIISLLNSNIKMAVGLAVIYLAAIFTRQMIEPKIVSSNIGMNPLLTLMSMYVGYRVFSIGGMILGPVVLMLVFSFYKAGIFDGLIHFFKRLWAFVCRECRNIKNMILVNTGGDDDE